MPATLAAQDIWNLVKNGSISSSFELADKQLQPASLDLTLGQQAYRVRGSFLPTKAEDVMDLVQQFALYEIDLAKPVTLEKNATYIVKLNEKLKLPKHIYAYTNNKSSTGRVDLQTRILTNKNPRFDKICAGYEGDLYLELSPKSFLLTVQAGLSLNQIRFFDCQADGNGMDIHAIYDEYHLLYDRAGHPIPQEQALIDDGLLLTLDLESDIIGYRSKNVNQIMDLTKVGAAKRRDFFQPIHRPDNGCLFLEKGHFYILSSAEFVRVPPEFSVEMIPYDIASGEFRSHYAGFFDPGFGYGTEGEIKGTPGVLEVRVYEDDFILRPGQPVCKIVYDKLLSPTEVVYGVGDLKSNYSTQRGPRLAKFFSEEK
ncbi:MAG: 2'-deoxycytidine 5'-triphosphate deaminase [Candidatus Gracilibacteria bacterium]|nr:2'-deoxycytidine 5'-triphosphate deaminase [Candidatus Gracilibacteria bacterium]